MCHKPPLTNGSFVEQIFYSLTNENIVGLAEGALVVNAVRKIFHYLSQKIRS